MLRTGAAEVTRRHQILNAGSESRNVDYACLNGIGQPRLLGIGLAEWAVGSSGGSGPRGFQLAGPYVTFKWEASSKYFAYEGGAVEQYDLRSGRRTFIASFPAGAQVLDLSSASGIASPELVASARGAAAWVLASMVEGSPVTLLVVHDARGTRTLDIIDTVLQSPYQITDVHLNGALLTWLHQGQPRSALLAR